MEDYGAFVDFGCKQQGLIHVSKLAVSRSGGWQGQAGRSRNAQPPPCLGAALTALVNKNAAEKGSPAGAN